MKYIIWDLETTTRESFGRRANPFDPNNKIVMSAEVRDDEFLATKYWPTDFEVLRDISIYLTRAEEPVYLVGHNVKFDLLYIWNMPEFNSLLLNYYRQGKLRIFDTQLAEYILTGQQAKMSSLNQLSAKYGGTQKDDRIKTEYWDEGMCTSEIPLDILREYAEYDVKNTEIVFKAQMKRAKELGMTTLIVNQMEALVATTEMEYNGMCIDIEKAQENKLTLEGQIMDLDRDMASRVARTLHNQGCAINEINLASPVQLSKFLFGGTIKVKKDMLTHDDDGNPIVYKTGKRAGEYKTKKIEVEYPMTGLALQPKEDWKTSRDGTYSTNNDVLSDLLETDLEDNAREFINNLLTYRALNKEHSTYYKAMLNATYPDKCVRGQLHHVTTDTGRLSSSSPNLQNISGKDNG